MASPESIQNDFDGVPWEVSPEWLAGRYWWRICVARHPRVLVRYNAMCAAEALAADEARFRREAGAAQ